MVFWPGDRGVVESDRPSPQHTGAIEEVGREEPAPRDRIRRDDARESIDTPAAGALCKAATRGAA